ncbi:alpha/beta hydrolase [Streptomyces sp. SCL15-6]|uniref:alpha/beta fold hydrolase n=1 Tax=Streptomyces sp. SCL15-6 TaxID=2967222 RepID=UPI002965D356|nr:alpha/beta hydrolase [Streptomyces sp. SCL15-6]
MNRRSFSIAAATVAAGFVATGVLTQTADATTTHTPRPTVVLVHGAWSDSSSWQGVAKRLQNDGYPVVAPAVPLRGLSSDAAYLTDYLKTINGPIVLVGHSYGGSVITQAATGNSHVTALVYAAAFAPDKGETASGLTAKFPGSHISDDANASIPTALNPVPFTENGTTNVDLYIKSDKFRDVFLSNRRSAREAAVLAATQRPVTPQALGEPTGTPAWKTIPSWYLVAGNDHLIPAATERYMAQRAHAHTSEVNAPHDVLLTNPGTVTHVIEDAAHTTAH